MTVKEYHSVQKLLSLAKSQSNPRLARRIQVVALARQGHSCLEIIKMTGNCRRAIQMWVAKYNDEGIDGLIDKPRTGRPAKLSVDRQGQFCESLDAGPTDTAATLYGRDIQHILRKNFGVIYTLDGVYKLLHRLGYSCLKPRPRHKKADPLVQKEFKKTSPRSWMKSNQSIRAKK